MEKQLLKRRNLKRILSVVPSLAMVAMFLLLSSMTVYADSASLTVEEDTTSTYSPTTIKNGDFETRPFMTFTYNGTTYESYESAKNLADNSLITSSTPNGVNGGWNTTETNTYQGGLFEWSNSKGTYRINSNTGYFVEMNANNPATLYQDLSTNGGDVILWTLDHCARGITEVQTMEVEVGAPDGTNPSGIGDNVNMHITEGSKAVYTSSGATGTYGKANSGDLTYLDVNAANDKNWHKVKGIYIVPDNQNVTRFAFKSTMTSNPACGNMLDNITFSTLIGNLHAVAQSDGSVKVTGYWGDSNSSKKLFINIGGTVKECDMSSVLNKNFAITIPASVIGTATSVEIYHEDYASAKKTVAIKTTATTNDFTFTAPSTLTSGTARSATVVSKSGVTGMGTITVYYSSDNGATWSTTAPSAAGTYKVAIDIAEGSSYSAKTKITDDSWTFTITPSKSTPVESDFSYDSSTGLISAKSGRDLGTVTTYYKVNGSWTTTKPTAAGTYAVGIVATGSSTFNTIGTASSPFTDSSWTYTVSTSAGDSGAVTVPEEKHNGNFAAGGLKNSVEELEKAVLTEEDKTAIASGKHINVWLKVEDISSSVSTQDKKKVKDKMPANYKEGIYIDFTLWKQITGNDAVKVTQTANGKVKIGFTIPEELQKAGRKYKIIRIHNGVATIIDTEIDSDFNVTFETDQFSTYALIYEETTNDSKTATIAKAPKTGDSNMVWYCLLLMMVGIGMMGMAFYKISKRV